MKTKRRQFPKSRAHPTRVIGGAIHSDVCGSASVQAIGGESYTVTWIDEKSCYGVVDSILAKSDAFTKYKACEACLRDQLWKEIKQVQSNRGGEYMGNEFINHLRQRGTAR